MSGKRLCTNAEWQTAALGTPDPHTTDPGDDSEPCSISENSKPAQAIWAVENEMTLTGSAPKCLSHFGSYDMVGNVCEWTADWWRQGPDNANGSQPDNGEFHGDGYWRVDSAYWNGIYLEGNPVFPASALHGGDCNSGSRTAVFALSLISGPADWNNNRGARCCRRK